MCAASISANVVPFAPGRGALSGAALVLALTLGCGATAQEKPAGPDANTPDATIVTDAIVVTATRREQPSIALPASVDRLFAEEIRFGRPQVNLSESIGRVPGIVVQNRQNYAQDLQISSRGFGARATFGIRGIRLIADGIPASMPDGQGQASNFDLSSAERIEVLRGAFSALYGNAAGGVVNVISENGPPTPELRGDLWAGSYRTRRALIKHGGENGALNWIMTVGDFRTDGYRDHSAATRQQLNAKLRYALRESTTATLVVNGVDQPETQDPLGLSRAQVQANPRQVDPGALSFNTRKSSGQDQAGLSITHALSGGGSLVATAYGGRRTVRQYLSIPLAAQNSATSSGAVVDLDRGFNGASLRFAQPVQLAGVDARLAIGAEREQQGERRKGYINSNGVQGAIKRDEDDTVTSLDGFAQIEARFGERWIAIAGVRTSRVSFRSTDYYIVAGNPDDSGDRTFSATNPVAGVVYRVTPALSWYANAGRGFETPTFAELAYRTGGSGLNFALQAARSRQLETGVKARLGDRSGATFALFDTDTRDEIAIDTNVGGRTTFKNVGRSTRRGAELGVETRLSGGLDAYLAWSRVDARFRERFTSGTPAVTVTAGNLIPGVPRDNFFAELRWRHAASGFRATLEAQRKDRVPVNDTNSEFADAYSVFNLSLGFTQGGGYWRISEFLRIDNLAGRRYIGSVIVNDGNGRFYEPAPGRNVLIGVQAAMSF